MFLETHKDIGAVRVGTPITVKFKYSKLGAIVDVQTSCDCTSITRMDAENALILTFKAKAIPPHLKQQGKTRYKVSKSVTLKIDNPDTHTQDTVVLTFNGTVYE